LSTVLAPEAATYSPGTDKGWRLALQHDSADMFIQSLDAFIQQAEELYRSNPLRVRYVLKYKHREGKLQLKVTDDKVVRARLAGAAACGEMRCSVAPRLLADICRPWVCWAQCLQYQTDQIADLRKVEKLNDRLFALMARGEEAAGALRI